MDARAACAALAACLRYPDPGLPAAAAAARRALEPLDAAAAGELAAFAAAVGEHEPAQLEEAYTRAFDLGPACVPYLSVHLFGEESFKRAALMTGLAEAYARTGFERGDELPDHVAVVLAWAPHATDDEWRDLQRLCLAGPLRDMAAVLAGGANPYRHVLAAAARLLQPAPLPEAVHA